MNIYILHLETATKSCSVALSLDGVLKQYKDLVEEGYSHGENLTLIIDEILQRENIEYSALSAISVSSGPGSYTGLRIGVSTAKGLCYALKIPLIAIDSLHCIQQFASESYPTHTIIPMIDARRMEVFSAVYDALGNVLKPISADVITAESYAEFLPFLACGDGAEKLKEIWNDLPISYDDQLISTARGQVKLAFSAFHQQQFEDVAYFEPFYLKDFVMQTKK